MSGERPANLTGSFQEGDNKQSNRSRAQGQNAGGKGLFSGQHKIKLNSSSVNQNQNSAGFTRLNSDQNVLIGNAGTGQEAAMRNSHY